MSTTEATTGSAATTTPVVTIAGYSHANLVVTDLDAALGFYVDVLGFSVLPRPDFGDVARGAWLRVGDEQLHLSVHAQMPDNQGSFPHTALRVPADRFAETVAALEAAGARFVMGHRTREDFGVPVQTVFIADPDGNVIELTDVPLLPH
jgi:catechol 2,3-dioxygenase-like lactoylglutathione lyase family enzyme